MDKDKDNDMTPIGQWDVPSGEAQRSWATVAEAAVAGALATDVYNDVKAASKAVVDKIRKPPDPPPPPPSGSASDGEA